MAIEDKISAREYEKFRVDGEVSNPQSGEIITIAVQPELGGEAISETNKLPVAVATNTEFVDLFRCLLETNQDILNELKTMNAHFSEWDGEEDGNN